MKIVRLDCVQDSHICVYLQELDQSVLQKKMTCKYRRSFFFFFFNYYYWIEKLYGFCDALVDA